MKPMMRIAAFALLLVFTGMAYAQSYSNNEYLKKSLELRALSTTAFDAGDYDAATAYAREAKDWALKSDEYIAKAMAAMTKADAARQQALARAVAEKAIAAATERYNWAVSVNAKQGYPSEFASATDNLDDARRAFTSTDYGRAKVRAEAVIAYLAGVSEFQPWPAAYKVRSISGRADCLWRIAEYSFIYNDPLKWPAIYEANRKFLKDPSNPNLIFPGQILTIPSLDGETRSGSYDPKKSYMDFPRAKK